MSERLCGQGWMPGSGKRPFFGCVGGDMRPVATKVLRFGMLGYAVVMAFLAAIILGKI